MSPDGFLKLTLECESVGSSTELFETGDLLTHAELNSLMINVSDLTKFKSSPASNSTGRELILLEQLSHPLPELSSA